MESLTPGSAERYSKQDVIDFLDGIEDADVSQTAGKDCELLVTWHGNNRREVFIDLLEHGWAVTSASSGQVWLEQLDKHGDAPDELWKAPRSGSRFPEDSYPDLDVVRQAKVKDTYYLLVPAKYEALIDDRWAGRVVDESYEGSDMYAGYDELAEAYVEAAE